MNVSKEREGVADGATRDLSMMLAERLAVLEGVTTADSVCPVGRLLVSLDDEVRGRLERLLSMPNRQISTREIHRELKACHIAIARDTISSHRRGWCICDGSV